MLHTTTTMAMQQFCLRWNNHQPNFISVFSNLLTSESLVDVTLAAEGRQLQAHRVVLSACSSYFQTLFTMNPCQHPIVILKDVKYDDLKIMVDFMYYGEVNISHEQLPAILKTAELLKVKGLAETPESSLNKQASGSSDRAELLAAGDAWDGRRSPSPLSPAVRRKRLRKSSTGSGSGSTERGTSEELITGEVTLVPSPVVVKPEVTNPGYSTTQGCSTDVDSGGTGRSGDSSLRTSGQEPSTDSDPRDGSGSRDSADEDPLAIHIPPEGECSTPKVESSMTLVDYGHGHSQVEMTHQMHGSPTGKAPPLKRKGQLVRQPRVKKEGDVAQEEVESAADSAPSSSVPPSVAVTAVPLPVPASIIQPAHSPPHQLLLTVPHRVERQSSEPGPSRSCQLLAVPQPATYLVKQHSDPQSQSVRQLPQPQAQPPPFHVQLVSTPPPDIPSRAASPSVVVMGGPVQVSHQQPQPSQEHMSQLQPAPSLPEAKVLPTLRVRTDELRRASSSPQEATYECALRSNHCPALRPGPALGCNYCWNTIDSHGRILRRKTKYYCPECQTNLCIVPCFQAYHERSASSASATSGTPKVLPKTGSI